MTKSKKRVLVLAGILISVGFLWIALRGTDFQQIGESLAKANMWMLAPMMIAYVLYYWIKAVRWRLLLMPRKDAPSRELFRPMMIGFFGNNVLPAHLGEFVRMYLGAKQLGLRQSEVLATIVLERMFDFLTVVFFLGAVVVLGRNVPADLVTIGYVTAAIGGVCLIGATVYVTWTGWFLSVVRAATGFLPRKISHGLVHQLEVAAMGMQSLRRPPLLIAIIITSIVQWAFMGATIYASLLAVGIESGLTTAFVVLAATTFGVTLPAAPGFLGTVQAAYVLALAPYGVARADAFAASAFFHVPTYLAVTLYGVWLLRRGGYSLGELQREAEASAEEVSEEPAS